jgi:hypothetical protein
VQPGKLAQAFLGQARLQPQPLDQRAEPPYERLMELRNGLASWEGEAATFGDFGEAAEEMAEASEEGNYAD